MVGRVASMTVGFRPAGIAVDLPGASRFQIEFRGAHGTIPAGAELQKSYTNYFVGSNPVLWRSHVPNYGQVRYPGLYPGIDAVFYGNGHQLEHDFLVSPGADYRAIRMHLSSNARASLRSDGALRISLEGGSVEMQKPFIYQDEDEGRKKRAGSFRILPDGDIGFTVGNYDPAHTLVIDPVLNFSTYLSNLTEYASLIATDPAGNNYVSGAASLGFPVTAGAFAGCATCSTGNVVTYIAKLSADGTTLLYSTVLGGNSFAQPTGIAVDANGDAIISGWTGASDFPTKNGQLIGPQNNNYVGFLLSLSPDGSALNYSTLLGSAPSASQSSDTYALAMVLDPSGNAYVTGETGNGFFTTPGALNQGGGGTYGNEFNVYLAKFAPAGGLVYSAVLGDADPQNGGGGPIGSYALTVDAAGNAYVAGQAGTLWPISNNAYLKQIAGPMPYATPFVMKVAPDAKSVVYSTYLDYAYVVTGVAVLPNGSLWITGGLPGATYPATAGAFQQNTGNNGGFLTQLDANGSSLIYSTLLGDSSYYPYGFALDSNGDIWIAGKTGSGVFPMVEPLESISPAVLPPETASLVSQFDPTGKSLKFSTFLGGSAGGLANSVAMDPNHRAHVAGAAGYGMYTTPGVYKGSVPVPGPGYTSAIYPYIALIDPTVPAPALCVAVPASLLGFYDVDLGTFMDEPATITSCGSQPLTIDSIASGAPVFTVPASENDCLQTLPVGQSCTFSVRYTPVSVGNDSSILTIQSNAPIPQTVLPLNGIGAPAPDTVLSPASLTFASQQVGTSSTAQTVTVTNSGHFNATDISIALAGTDATSFAETNTCGAVLNAGGSCTISVTFQPTAAGAASAIVTIADSLVFSTQFVTLSGTATQSPFAITTQTNGSTSSTVTRGQPASYALSLLPAGGYSGTVTLTCGNLPVNASCSFTPSSLTLGGGNAAAFTATVATKSVQTGMLVREGSMGAGLAAFLLLLTGAGRKRGFGAIAAGVVLLVLTATLGCGGNGSSAPLGVTPQQTTVAPGTYTVQVIASDGNTRLTQPLTLVVQ